MAIVWVFIAIYLITLGINFYYVKVYSGIDKIPKRVVFHLAVRVLVLPLLVPALITFWCVRNVIRLILYIRHKNHFLGLFEGTDAMHIRIFHGTIQFLLVIELNEEEYSKEHLVNNITNVVNNAIVSKNREFSKFCSTVKSFLGYEYMLYQNVNADQCVKKMNVLNKKVLSRDDVMELISQHSFDAFPYEDKLMWDVYVGTEPIIWHNDSNKRLYPVVFRFNHALTDAVNFLRFLTGMCANFYGNDKQPINIQCATKSMKALNLLKSVRNTAGVVLLCPAVDCIFRLIKETVGHIDNKLEKGGISRASLDVSQEYLFKIKKIISRYKRATFNGVLCTALSASFEDYCIKHIQDGPKYCMIYCLLFHPNALGTINLRPGSLNEAQVNIRNEYNIIYLLVPVSSKTDLNLKNEPLLNRLNAIMNDINSKWNAGMCKVMQTTLELISTFTPSWTNQILPTFPKAMSVSNLPGPTVLTLGESNLKVHDTLFFTSSVSSITNFLTATSYENRLQFGSSVPSWIFSKKSYCTDIADNLYKYIDLLLEEVDQQFL